jgi:hypothetical protein
MCRREYAHFKCIMVILFIRFTTRFVILSLLIFPAYASSRNLDRAVEALRAGDFAEAYCIMRPLAEYGDAEAQYNIGWMYMNGYGLRVNDQLALEWWQKASRQNFADASFSIGMLYSLGEGDVPQDPDKAIDYYVKALEQGNEDAITVLQTMMLRNDSEIRSRMHMIASQHADSFGIKRKVKVDRLNARNGASTEAGIVTQLHQGETVLEIYKQGQWSQVVVLDDDKIDRTVWVYNPLLESITES